VKDEKGERKERLFGSEISTDASQIIMLNTL
jgi:hypothetical protein